MRGRRCPGRQRVGLVGGQVLQAICELVQLTIDELDLFLSANRAETSVRAAREGVDPRYVSPTYDCDEMAFFWRLRLVFWTTG
jgi:hypothetical protein